MSIRTTIVELGPKRPSPLWFLVPKSIIVVYMNPIGYTTIRILLLRICLRSLQTWMQHPTRFTKQSTQSLQYPLIQEYTLSHIGDPIII